MLFWCVGDWGSNFEEQREITNSDDNNNIETRCSGLSHYLFFSSAKYLQHISIKGEHLGTVYVVTLALQHQPTFAKNINKHFC